MKQYTVAILGATGAVGTQMLECLNEQEFPVGKLKLLASARSAGKTVEFRGEQVVIEEACPEAFEGCDIVLGAAGDDIAKELLPEAVKRGAVVIDNSHAFRMDPEVPLVVPEINADDIKWHHGLIANPNCATIIGLVPTWPLQALVPAAAPALRACRLGGLRSAAGSCGALRLLPAGTLGPCGSCGALRLLPWVTLGSIGVVCTIRGIMLRSFERSRWWSRRRLLRLWAKSCLPLMAAV